MIHHIDCLKFLETTADESFDVCISSPPYNLGVNYRQYKDTREDYISWMKEVWYEVCRVLKPNGFIDILMISRDDGDNFKKSVVAAQKKHLTFSQIMRSAALVQRVSVAKAEKAFSVFSENYRIEIAEKKDIVYGSFDEHMKWWKARSTQIIAEVKDVQHFMSDLQSELEKIEEPDGIPFDSAFLWIKVRGKRK